MTKNNRLLIMFIMLFGFVSILLFSFKCHGQIAFTNTYGNNNEDYGRGICHTADSGFYVTGSTNSFAGNTNLYLFKIDKNGNLLWSKNTGGLSISWGSAVIETQDGGAAALGYTNSFGNGGYDFFLVKSDSFGNILWQKTYGGSDWEFGYSIAEDNSGNLYLAGETYSFGAGNNDGYIVKTNSLGEVIWEKTYGTILYEKIKKIILLSDGSLAYGATTEENSDGDNGDFIISKIDSTGAEIWIKQYPYETDDEISSLVETYDNNLVFTGSSNPGNFGGSDYFYQKINVFDGSLIWGYFGGCAQDDYAYGIIEMKDGDLVITGLSYNVNYLNGGLQNYRFASNGDYQPFSPFNPEMGGTGFDAAYDIANTLDNGYIAVGQTNSYGNNSQVFIVKVDSNNAEGISVINIPDVNSETITHLNENNNPTLTISPNPFADYLKIASPENKIDQLIIRNAIGNLVFNQTITNNQEINVKELKNGFYILEIYYQKQLVARIKVIKSGG